MRKGIIIAGFSLGLVIAALQVAILVVQLDRAAAAKTQYENLTAFISHLDETS